MQVSVEEYPFHIGDTSEIARTFREQKVLSSSPGSHQKRRRKSSRDKNTRKNGGGPGHWWVTLKQGSQAHANVSYGDYWLGDPTNIEGM